MNIISTCVPQYEVCRRAIVSVAQQAEQDTDNVKVLYSTVSAERKCIFHPSCTLTCSLSVCYINKPLYESMLHVVSKSCYFLTVTL